jgi:hypothetical protein
MLIGTPPEVFLAAAAPIPYDEDEIALAASLAPGSRSRCARAGCRAGAPGRVVRWAVAGIAIRDRLDFQVRVCRARRRQALRSGR